MKVLVTGAAGFIGRHVVKALEAAGHEVEGIARADWDLATGPISPIDVDALVHTAATSPESGVSWNQVVRDSVTATANLVRSVTCRKIIFCSSMSAYGEIDVEEVDVSTPSINPDAYGASKLICEELIAETEIPALALRLPGIVGKGARRCWLARVAEKLLADESVPLYDPDAPFNNAVHVKSLADFIVSLIDPPMEGFYVAPIAAENYMSIEDVVCGLATGLGKEEPRFITQLAQKQSFTISSDALVDDFAYDPQDIHDVIEQYAEDLR
jgi:UDP-glucose 4-epimerase